MIFVKRVSILLGLVLTTSIFLILRLKTNSATWRDTTEQPTAPDVAQEIGTLPTPKSVSDLQEEHTRTTPNEASKFQPGVPKPPGSNYTRAIVIGHTIEEDVTWLNDSSLWQLDKFIYQVDTPRAPLHVPKNKGHEAMVYLTYIIDHYETLPDVSIFLHAHRNAWHTNELLNHDALEVLKHLSSERVVREGYMNLRCHLDPGCPERLHPGAPEKDSDWSRLEEGFTPRVWDQLFPGEPVPAALGAPCCAQFALSRERILSVPKKQFQYYRDWLLNTPLSDWVSGRIFEYLWQKIFADQVRLCPDMQVCYCDGYGICFEDAKQFDYWFELRYRQRELDKQLRIWNGKATALEGLSRDQIEGKKIEIPEVGKDILLQQEFDQLYHELGVRRLQALRRGLDPRVRAAVAGREWKPGDGY